MIRELDVIVAGEVYLDLILSGFDTWPQLGQESFAKEFRREVGGGTAITACGLANLGLKTAVLATLGSEDGQWVANRLDAYGVNTSRLSFENSEPTGFSVVATVTEDRAFLSYSGANRMFESALSAAACARQLARCRHLHLAYVPSLEKGRILLDNVRANGCTISLDTGWRPTWLADPSAIEIIQRVDIFFPNELEASRLTGKTEPVGILNVLRDLGIKNVALKLGPRGSALLADGAISFVPSIPVMPRDTTGAGDCFDAGFLYAWLRGESPASCLLAGNICGALSTEHYGGLSGFPTRLELESQMERARR